jgi:hypothetical protein
MRSKQSLRWSERSESKELRALRKFVLPSPLLLFPFGLLVLLRIPRLLRQRRHHVPKARRVELVPPSDSLLRVGTVRACADASQPRHAGIVSVLVVRDDDGILLRDVRATPFIVEPTGAPSFRVLGEVELVGKAKPSGRDQILALEAKLGIRDWCGEAARAESIVLSDGDRVEVWGTPRVQRVADGYRDSEEHAVVGQPGKPVFVRRL